LVRLEIQVPELQDKCTNSVVWIEGVFMTKNVQKINVSSALFNSSFFGMFVIPFPALKITEKILFTIKKVCS